MPTYTVPPRAYLPLGNNIKPKNIIYAPKFAGFLRLSQHMIHPSSFASCRVGLAAVPARALLPDRLSSVSRAIALLFPWARERNK
jgi:hypothetical protein